MKVIDEKIIELRRLTSTEKLDKSKARKIMHELIDYIWDVAEEQELDHEQLVSAERARDAVIDNPGIARRYFTRCEDDLFGV